MNKLMISAAIGAVLSMGTAQAAMTIGYTEGNRDLVPGTVKIGDAAPSAIGFDIDQGFGDDALDNHDVINLFGRIVGSEDTYNFFARNNFVVAATGDGVTVEDGPAPHNVYFSFDNQNTGEEFVFVMGSDDNLEFLEMMSDDLDMGALTAGSYILSIDMDPDNMGRTALYDIQMAGVPIPGALPLFGAGLAGLGLARRKRRTA